uniref:Ribosomal protein S20 n=1 Tax=Palmaria palmata TaxID=2822 RepID=A0A1C9CH20_PALPL|nr:ribosomal protein S20 [Palmaria palmata]AOM67669.1 ribosomal protein S20 [Palmaria palmata]
MAKNLSVMKRIAVAERNRCQNKVYKSTIKTLTKKYLEELNQPSSSQDVQLMLNKVYSKIDKAVKRRILHKNNAARKKAFLAKALKLSLL